MLLGIIGILSAVGAFLAGCFLGFLLSRSSSAKELRRLRTAAVSAKAVEEAAEQRVQAATDHLQRALDQAKQSQASLEDEVSILNKKLEEYASEEDRAKETIQQLKTQLATIPSPAGGDETTRIDEGVVQIQQDAERVKKQFEENKKLLLLAQSEVKQAQKTARDAMTKAQAEVAASQALQKELAELKKRLASVGEERAEKTQVDEAGWSLEDNQAGGTPKELIQSKEELAALKKELDQRQEELVSLKIELDQFKAKELDQLKAKPAAIAAIKVEDKGAAEHSVATTDKTADLWSAPRPAKAPPKDTINPFDLAGATKKTAGPSAFAQANPFSHLTTKAKTEPLPAKSPAPDVKGTEPHPAPRDPEPRPALSPAVAVEQTKSKTPEVQPPKEGGPTVMDVLETDPSLNPGIREAIRTIYVRYAPGVRKSDSAAIKTAMTVKEALETDPNLNRGQRETIRAVISRVASKT